MGMSAKSASRRTAWARSRLDGGGLDWLEVDGSVNQVNVTASAAGSSAYAEIDMNENLDVTTVIATAGTGGGGLLRSGRRRIRNDHRRDRRGGHGGAGGGGVSLWFDGLNAQTYYSAPSVINASGGQDLSVALTNDSESFSALNAGTMTGNVTVSVEDGLRRSGHDDHDRQRQRRRAGRDRREHAEPRDRSRHLRLQQRRRSRQSGRLSCRRPA